MPEEVREEFRIKHFKIKMPCPRQGCDGEMVRKESFRVLGSNPPIFAHRCSKCEAEETYSRKYPRFAEEREIVKPAGSRNVRS